jgi:hypothetical protein
MSTIPFSSVVNIVPGVISAGGTAVDLNAVVLTQSIYAPQNQVLGFATSAAVAAYFGSASPEAVIAAGYFQGPDNLTGKLITPGMLYFLGYAEAAVPGWLLGAASTPPTLAALNALSPGTLSINVAGTVFTSSTINLTAVGSFSAAAAAMLAAFTSPTFNIVYDALHQAFLITSTATGVAETITYCSGTLAAGVGLNVGTLSQGANAAVPATQMNWLTANFQNWATFGTTWAATLNEREAFATWSNANAPRYAYVPWDTDVADQTLNNPASFGGWLAANSIVGTIPVYGTASHMALVMSWAASLNFSALNGRVNLDFISQSGLAPSVTDSTTYANVISNGYNVYGSFGSNNPANNANWLTPGSASGIWLWADTYMNQIWLNANLQLGIVTGLRSAGQVPYNSDGDAIIAGWCGGTIQQALAFGVIRKGVTMSAAQVQQITSLTGADVSATITAQGYYLYVNAAGTAPAVRAKRASPPTVLLYQDGESVQKITMPSLVIQ